MWPDLVIVSRATSFTSSIAVTYVDREVHGSPVSATFFNLFVTVFIIVASHVGLPSVDEDAAKVKPGAVALQVSIAVASFGRFGLELDSSVSKDGVASAVACGSPL